MELQQQLELLVLRARDRDEQAFNELYDRFFPVIDKLVKKCGLYYKNKDDLLSRALGGFMRAIYTYNPDIGTPLEYWIIKNIKWKICSKPKSKEMYDINTNESIITLSENNVLADDLLDCSIYLREIVNKDEKYLLHLLLIFLKEFLGYRWKYIVQILNHQKKPEIWDEIINHSIFIFEIFPELRDWNRVRSLINSLNLPNGLFTEENIRQRYSRVQKEMQNMFNKEM